MERTKSLSVNLLSFRFLVFFAMIFAAVFIYAPSAWASNSWNSPNMVIDNFSTGSLSTAIAGVIGDSPYTDITSITVSGAVMDGADFTFITDNLSSIETIDISGVTITALPDYAFYDLNNLQYVTLPAGLTSIGDYAFSFCGNLALTSLPAGVTSIGNDAFSFCGNLALTSLPAGVNSIGDSAFANCVNLALTSLPAGVISIGFGTFDNCTNLALTSLPAGVTSIGFGTFNNCANLALTNLPAGVTSIGDYAFYDCVNLALTTLPAGLTSIGDAAFVNCANLALTSLPSGVTSIGSHAFVNCTNLTLTNLPAGVTLIGDYAFYDCANLALTDLPAGVTSIGDYAFYDCASLTWLDMSSCTSLTMISSNAFEDCYFLEVVAMPPVLPTTIASDAFSGVASSLVFLVPDTVLYTSWTPPVGSKITISDGSITPTGSTVVTAGGNISFSCAEIVGASYQWQKEISPGVWTILAGAASVTYLKNNAAVSDSGSYRASITFGAITPFHTAPISLTVTVVPTPTYTITFDSRGGSAVAAATATPGSTITAPTVPTQAGYSFVGWYKEAACNNAWNFSTDTVTSDITLYANWTPDTDSGGLAAESMEISGFPLTLAPGNSFTATVTYTTADGSPPSPVPNIGVSLDARSAALVRVDILSSYSARIIALPQEPRASAFRAAPTASIYGEALISFEATQILSDGSTVRMGMERTLVVADGLPTSLKITTPVTEGFQEANRQLISSGIVILPGNTQQPMTDLPSNWQSVGSLDNIDIYVREPDGSKLPDCYAPTGKAAADIVIDISRVVPPGKNGIVPMTYRVTMSADDLANALGSSMASQILADPYNHLDEIFGFYVIQKEIQQGERTGWYTRLVDGILTPQRAIELGILDITGGSALDMTLSYYILDDSILETYESGGYLIVPDGLNDNLIVDPIWLNRWKDGAAPDDNSLEGGDGGGGGCNGGAAVLMTLFIAAIAIKSDSLMRR